MPADVPMPRDLSEEAVAEWLYGLAPTDPGEARNHACPRCHGAGSLNAPTPDDRRGEAGEAIQAATGGA